MNNKDLPERMVKLADKEAFDALHELRVSARDLSEAFDDYFRDDPKITVGSFLGRYARARRIWCKYSGDPLVNGY